MKPIARFVIPAGLVVVVSVALTKYWYANPNAFPKSLIEIGLAGMTWLGVEGSEAASDVEAVYVVAIALSVALVAVLTGVAVWRLMVRGKA